MRWKLERNWNKILQKTEKGAHLTIAEDVQAEDSGEKIGEQRLRGHPPLVYRSIPRRFRPPDRHFPGREAPSLPPSEIFLIYDIKYVGGSLY